MSRQAHYLTPIVTQFHIKVIIKYNSLDKLHTNRFLKRCHPSFPMEIKTKKKMEKNQKSTTKKLKIFRSGDIPFTE